MAWLISFLVTIGVAATVSARAEGLTFTTDMPPVATLLMQSGDNIYFNWQEIVRCGSLPLPGIKRGDPGMDSTASWQWHVLEMKMQSITLCRQLVAAYQAGMTAHKNGSEPLPQIPIARPDDMKVYCRFENHMDHNGNGWMACYLPEEQGK